MRRIRPLPTWLSMARRANSVIPTKGMHCRAAEKAGTEGPRVSERHGRLGSISGKAGAAGPCQRAWGGLHSPRGTQQGSSLGKQGGQWGAQTPRVSLQWVPTLQEPSCWPALACSGEAWQFHSPPAQHRAFRKGEDPCCPLPQTPTQTGRPRVPYRSCGTVCLG